MPPATILVDPSGVRYTAANVATRNGFLAVWDGFIYQDDGKSGQAAVHHLIDQVVSGTAVSLAMAHLRGCYFLVVHDPKSGQRCASVDSGGLYSAYWSESAVGTSFLALLREAKTTGEEVNPHAVVEFLQLGNVYFGDTFTPFIRKIAAHEVAVVDKDGVTIQDKPVSRLTEPPVYGDLFEATEGLARAVRNKALSIDLTGGFDSRLLACLLVYHNVPFEAALSSYQGHIDARLGSEVAQALRRPFYYTEYDPDDIVEQLETLLVRLDALGGAIGTCHRLLKLNQARRERGVELTLKGQGGEMYKDFFWTHDFPFYRRKKSRIQKMHRLRIEFEFLSRDVLTHRYYQIFMESRQRRLQRLRQYELAINTQTYDNVYYRERIQTWNSRMITSCQRCDLPTHAPLCELELAKLGFWAPRRERFYNRMHRKYVTHVNVDAARVRTTDGTSASSYAWDMAKDVGGYAQVKLRKLARKVAQYYLNRTLFSPDPFDVNARAADLIVTSQLAGYALETLKEAEIVRPAATYKDISSRFRENFVVAGWFLSQLHGGRAHHHPAVSALDANPGR